MHSTALQAFFPFYKNIAKKSFNQSLQPVIRLSVSMPITDLYSVESWDISTALCVLSYLSSSVEIPKFTAIIQSRRLTLFGHIMRMDDNADAKRILLAFPPADWRRQLGRPCITWLSTVQQDSKQHHLMLPEATDLAQNRPLWRMMSTYGAAQL